MTSNYYGNTKVDKAEDCTINNYGIMYIASGDRNAITNYGAMERYDLAAADNRAMDATIRQQRDKIRNIESQRDKLEVKCNLLARENARLKAMLLANPPAEKAKEEPKPVKENDLAEKIDILMEANREAAKRIRELESQVDGMKARREEWDVKPTKRDCEEVVRMLGLFIDDNI